MIRMLITVLISINLFYLAFAQDTIEGRWHLVGYEDAIMYQFVDIEPFADAGLRYSIYVDENGEFDDLDGDNIGGTPHPYSVVGDIITIDTHFGNILSYQMNYRCEGQVVEFKHVTSGIIHSTLFREDYNYIDNNCEECFDFSGLDFGPCAMVLGTGYLNGECAYVSGCDWAINGIDYSDLFFDSMEDCNENCDIDNQCEDGFIEINSLCFHQGDIDIIQLMIDNSYQSGIDLGCQDGDNYCGSPNPFMDSADNWGWIGYDGTAFEIPGNENGFVEPLELGIQQWQDGRLTALDCGVYIYCQLSGSIPEQMNDLTELEHFRVEGNYLSGLIPESICQLNIDYNNYLDFDVSYNRLCPPYPDCIDTDYEFWGQYDEECIEIGLLGDLNNDSQINIVDVILIVNAILNGEYNNIGDLNEDGSLDIIDVVAVVQLILNNNTLPEDCYIIPEVGPCDGICPTYYFNQNTNQCEEFITGCCGVEAFNTMQGCIDICE